MITLSGISKQFKVATREKGVGAAIGSLFHREYKTVQALDNVSFAVGKGEIIGYIGPNGAGKSTTIKVMSGILTPDSGTCEVMGFTPWKNRRAYVANIGVVFGQRTQLWWDVPVMDSYDLLRSIYKIPPDRYKKTLERLTEMLELAPLLGTPLRQLSLGQRMRCEVAASMLHAPSILFLDEPTIGLDAVSKLRVRAFIKQLNIETGVTVLLTTHDMNDIEALTDRIVLIGKGRVLHDGSMRDVRARYDTARVLTVLFKTGAAPFTPEGTTLLSWADGRAAYELDSADCRVSDVIASLSNHMDIRDIEIAARPVEEIIAALYERYRV
ncbi:MAG: ABC transporter ATP-binding protein [Oscillospiraceae bacterium]|nr:ABC transporter ATP-binding protein [Oscillospiraceae bacterium]